MAKKYSYSAEDQSILSPILYKFFVNPLVAILPYRVPANFITFSSFLCIITAFCVALVAYSSTCTDLSDRRLCRWKASPKNRHRFTAW